MVIACRGTSVGPGWERKIVANMGVQTFFFFKQEPAYEIWLWLDFRRVLFRSDTGSSEAARCLLADAGLAATARLARVEGARAAAICLLGLLGE